MTKSTAPHHPMAVLTALLIVLSFSATQAQPLPAHNLSFTRIPASWDEGLPLGNGLTGALIWHNGKKLRMSLDRADLWDEREAIDLKKNNITYAWVKQQWLANNYAEVQKFGDQPYEDIPWPTKLPGAALEFNLHSGAFTVLNIASATAALDWSAEKIRLECFVHAEKNFGVFILRNAPEGTEPDLVPPMYQQQNTDGPANSVEGQSLQRLGYTQGVITRHADGISYLQQGAGGFRYEVSVAWKRLGKNLLGVWSIAAYPKEDNRHQAALEECRIALQKTYEELKEEHAAWWKNYWSASEVRLPDPMLDRQYHLEMYKLGSVARTGAPPISLQAVWTADNGKLPPWKGDFHHDLNTQLSYWPAYTGNQMTLAQSYTDWLWKVREENREYTRTFFGVDGLNVPGVTTLSGKQMGGWIQYSFSPTISAWLAQHFYWQWIYSGDENFLRERAYPYIRDAAVFLDNVMITENGKRYLPLSSSPEYHDNRREAWFGRWTNYDLALVENAFRMAEATALKAGFPDDAAHWRKVRTELPAPDTNETGLTIAPGQNLDESHRHIAQLMALFPLGTLNPDSKENKQLIDASLKRLEEKGTSLWTGYSFSWAACLYARAKAGNKAGEQLRIFADNFCLPNSFHANGDQKTGQYSRFRYRPFTLEGNLAFARGVHEMLMQSHTGIVEIFPALPDNWPDITFRNLRAENGFLITATRSKGRTETIEVTATTDASLRIRVPDHLTASRIPGKGPANDVQSFPMKAGETIRFTRRQ